MLILFVYHASKNMRNIYRYKLISIENRISHSIRGKMEP